MYPWFAASCLVVSAGNHTIASKYRRNDGGLAQTGWNVAAAGPSAALRDLAGELYEVVVGPKKTQVHYSSLEPVTLEGCQVVDEGELASSVRYLLEQCALVHPDAGDLGAAGRCGAQLPTRQKRLGECPSEKQCSLPWKRTVSPQISLSDSFRHASQASLDIHAAVKAPRVLHLRFSRGPTSTNLFITDAAITWNHNIQPC